MKIHLASATLTDIRWAVDHGLADGIVTSPALLAAERAGDGEVREHLEEICRSVALPVTVSVAAVDPGDIHRDGRELAKLGDNVVVQVPFVDDAVVAIRRLTSDGVRVAASLVFSAAQALMAAKSGAQVVTVPIDQLDALGQDSMVVVHEMRRLFDRGEIECDLMTAFPRSAAEFTACGLHGADAVTIGVSAMRDLLVHPLTDRGVDHFLRDLTARPRPRIAPV
jgi:transaldolase